MVCGSFWGRSGYETWLGNCVVNLFSSVHHQPVSYHTCTCTHTLSLSLSLSHTHTHTQYRSLLPMYYRNAAAAVIVYDITCEATFDVLQEWITELHRLGPPNIVLAIAGNKCDLEDKREVSLLPVREPVKKWVCMCMQCFP